MIKRGSEFLNKKEILFLLSVLIITGFLVFVVSDAVMNPGTLTPAGNYSNSPGYSAMSFNCSLNSSELINLKNVTIYYNASGGAAGTYLLKNSSSLKAGIGGNYTNWTINWTVNYTFETVNFTAQAGGLTEGLRTYNFSCRFCNTTGDACWFNGSMHNITIDYTAPTITPLDIRNYTYGSVAKLNVTVSDAVIGMNRGSVIFNITNSTNTAMQVSSNRTLAYNVNLNNYNLTFNLTGLVNTGDLKEGKYTLHIYANDSLNNTAARTYVGNFTVDGTAPNVTMPSIINTRLNAITGGNYSGTMMVNVSVWDLYSDAGSVYFNITNASNSSTLSLGFVKANSTNGVTYSAGINTVELPDGVYNITVYANDSAGNMNVSYLKIGNFTIDNTAPTATFSCSPTSTTIGQTVACTCTPTDALSGANASATSYTTNPSTGSSGTFTQTCTYADYAGKTGSSTTTYTVNSLSEGAGTGGGGGGTATETHSWSKITPGAATIMKNFDPAVGVKEISIEVNNEAQSVQVSVTKYDGKPAEVSVEKTGKVDRYLHIDTKNLESKLKKAVLTIEVAKNWVSQNGLTKEDVAVYKFDEVNSKWNELTTTYSEADATNYYYTVQLNSFSYFAVSEKAKVETPSEGGETPISADEEGVTVGGVKLTWLWVVIGVVVLAALVSLVLAKKKKR